MKSFREFIIEKSEADPISRKDAEKLQRMARPETSSSSAERIRRGLESAQERKVRKTRKAPSALTQGQLAGAWKSGSEGKPSVMATSNKPEGGTWFGSSKETIKKGQEELRQQVRDTLAKNKGGSAELQAAQSSGPKETMVGKGAKPGTGETYRAGRPSETKATGLSSKTKKGRVSGSVSKGDIKFSGDAKYKEMLAKLPDAKPRKPRTRTVKQAEVSKKAAEFRAKESSKSKPSTKSPTPKQLEKFTTGQQKRYIGKTGAPTPEGIQTYVTRSATRGYGDPDYDPVKRGVKDPQKAAKSVENIVSRASRGEKSARREVKRSYKAMVRRYKDIVPSSQRTKVGFEGLRDAQKRALERSYNAPDAKRPPLVNPPSGSGRGGSGGGAPKSPGGGTATLEKQTTKPLDIKQAPQKPKSKVTTNTSVQSWQGPAKPKPKARASAPATPTAKPATTKTTRAFLKGLGRGVGKAAGVAGVGYDAFSAYSSERAKGSSQKRSIGKSAAKVLGGALGGTLGAVGGGGFGSAALGIGGYMAGSELAGRAFDVAAGATKQQKATMAKLNRQSQKMQSVVKPNVSKSVTSTGDIVTRTTAVDPTKLAKQKVIKDKSGKERVGYLVKKGGTYGYKTGADPSTLAKTSSNPLERIGRTLFPGAYVQSDEAARKKRVAALKAKG